MWNFIWKFRLETDLVPDLTWISIFKKKAIIRLFGLLAEKSKWEVCLQKVLEANKHTYIAYFGLKSPNLQILEIHWPKKSKTFSMQILWSVEYWLYSKKLICWPDETFTYCEKKMSFRKNFELRGRRSIICKNLR